VLRGLLLRHLHPPYAGQLEQRPGLLEALTDCQGAAIPRELATRKDEIGTCDQKLSQYRAALDSGADPAVVGQWITETQARKLAADARLRAAAGFRQSPARMTKEQIAATVTTIRDLVRALRTAATEDKAEIYAGLNLQLTYQPQERIVNTRAEVGQTCTKGSCPRGDLNPHALYGH
jgi:site-specific DNA recombinase